MVRSGSESKYIPSLFVFIFVIGPALFQDLLVEFGFLLLLCIDVDTGNRSTAKELYLVAILVEFIVIRGRVLGSIPIKDEFALMKTTTTLTLLFRAT